MKFTEHIKTQIENAQGAGIDLTQLEFAEGCDPENPYLVESASKDPVPPGTPPPVPPVHG